MNILIIGRGRMGTLVKETAIAAGDRVLAALDQDDLHRLESMGKADVVVDFSAPSALEMVIAYVRRTATPYLTGVTGLSEEQLRAIRATGAYAPVIHSANYSLGVAVLEQALRQISGVLLPDFDVELTETHHNRKVDAPSGTAKLLLNAIDPRHEMTPVYGREGMVGAREKKEIGIHALRGGTVAGEHTIHFFGSDEELVFTHRAASRQIFVTGALHMARILSGQKPGFYALQNLLFGEK